MSAADKTAIRQEQVRQRVLYPQSEIDPVRDLHMAIGYLSTWNMTFPFVDIYVKDVCQPELLAVYRRELDGPCCYSIGAILTDGNFTFHS
jgi:hypothetical protein